jgi:hypothetical protein
MGDSAALAHLHFGRDDAETDITSGLLREGFLPTAAYQAALAGQKSLIIGRKGSGKSAICRWLALEQGHGYAATVVTPDDAAGDEIRRFELQGVNPGTAKSLVWRYVFAIQAARHLVACAPSRPHRRPHSVRALRQFLSANGETQDRGLYERLITGIHGLKTSLSLEAFGVKAALDVQGMSEGAHAARQLGIVESGVAQALADLADQPRFAANDHLPLLLLVDQLEQVWSNDPESDNAIVGLLLASKHVGSIYNGRVRCVLFIRSDIYDALEFPDGDKFRGDEMRIDWSVGRLAELVLARARASLGEPVTGPVLWGELFPAVVGNEPMPMYIFARTLRRPRDVIQLLNCSRDTAERNQHDQIDESDMKEAMLEFSRWKLQDLSREYLVNYPFLDRLYLMFQNTGYIVMRAALKKRFESLAPALHDRFREYRDVLTPEYAIEILYRVGFIGVRRGTYVVYADRQQLTVQPHEDEFHVHPCFRPALNADEPTGLPYAPSPGQAHIVTSADNVGQMVVGRDSYARPSLAGRLFSAVERSADRILSAAGSAGMPPAVTADITKKITKVMLDTRAQRQRTLGGGQVDAIGYLYESATYLDTLVSELIRNELAVGRPAQIFVRTIQEEANRLRGEASGRRSDRNVNL